LIVFAALGFELRPCFLGTFIFHLQRLKKAFEEITYVALENCILAVYCKATVRESIHKQCILVGYFTPLQGYS
jgi:hypothetical protein